MTTTQTQHAADVIGAPITDLDTPCLLLNWPVVEQNLRTMHGYFADRHAKLRPHFKNHKCATLARKQIEAGNCVGMTCAKVGEAEVLADAGFDDLLIANQVIGRRKIARLIDVARKTRVACAVDDIKHIIDISKAASEAGVTVGLLVEVDGGMGRCGVQPTPATDGLDLARQIEKLPGVTFGGLQSFEGHAIYLEEEERYAKTREAQEKAIATRRMIEKAGIEVPVISGGSSATYKLTGNMDGIDEIQTGTYATMDWRYQQLSPEFGIALTLLASVISAPRAGEVVLDTGVKGAGGEFGLPQIVGAPDVDIPYFLSEEHTVVRNAPHWKVGDTVQVIPSHACTTCNLHRQFFVHDGKTVTDVWPIEGSGKLA